VNGGDATNTVITDDNVNGGDATNTVITDDNVNGGDATNTVITQFPSSNNLAEKSKKSSDSRDYCFRLTKSRSGPVVNSGLCKTRNPPYTPDTEVQYLFSHDILDNRYSKRVVGGSDNDDDDDDNNDPVLEAHFSQESRLSSSSKSRSQPSQGWVYK
jgi:hypothetical protein